MNEKEAKKLVRLILKSAELSNIYRYKGHQFWETETLEYGYASGVETNPRLESVADHSWHLADIVMLLAPRFRELNLTKCLSMAILHDKLELFTGDKSPVGRSAKNPGKHTYAFDLDQRNIKTLKEQEALDHYLSVLDDSTASFQESLFLEMIATRSPEARFIKSLDRLQTLTYILRKKKGDMKYEHLRFTINYTRQATGFYPGLTPIWQELVRNLICLVAASKNVSNDYVRQKIAEQQLQLVLDPQPVDRILKALTNVNGRQAQYKLALSGKTGAGKTTVATILAQEYGFMIARTGRRCRDIAREFFSSESKTVLNRITDFFRDIQPGIWLRLAIEDVPPDFNRVVIDSLRFPEDLDYAKRKGYAILRVECSLDTRILRLGERGQEYDPDVDESHAAETALDDVAAVDRISNENEGVSGLEESVRLLLQSKRA